MTYLLTDNDGFELPCATKAEVFAAIGRQGEDVRVYSVEGKNSRRHDVTRDMALLWWQNECTCIYSIPEPFEAYLQDEAHIARDRAEDPHGREAYGDWQVHERMNG
jgi:hypothetical protein